MAKPVEKDAPETVAKADKVEWPVEAAKAEAAKLEAAKAEAPSKVEAVKAPIKPAPQNSAPAAKQPKAPPKKALPKAKPAPKPAAPAPVAAKPIAAKAPTPPPAFTKTESSRTEPPKKEPAVVEAELTKGTLIMTDAMETAKTYAEDAKTRIQSAVTEMNDKAKTAMEKSGKAMEEMGELTKGNLEAMVESSKIAAKGMETLSQEAVEFGRKSFEKSSATFKNFASIKSPTEFFQLQSELMSSAMDSFASQAAKNSEAMLKLAGDVSKPISNRVAIVSEKIKSIAA